MASDFIFDDKGNTLFDYSLRVSRKARYAKLQIKPYLGLEVVIPARFPKKAVPDLIRQHADWINRQLNRHAQQFQKPQLPQLPQSIYLTINQRDYSFQYRHQDLDNRVKELRDWIRQQAWDVLPTMLEQVAARCGLAYNKVSIRSQKTRWGSCSSRGTISLNDQLVFVPKATAEYLMIHELCHTRHMNHSVEFWALVESHCADYRYHESVLNRVRGTIPDWFQYSLYS